MNILSRYIQQGLDVVRQFTLPRTVYYSGDRGKTQCTQCIQDKMITEHRRHRIMEGR